jgi:glycosyltransferase involved in cell wall biosynthesis
MAYGIRIASADSCGTAPHERLDSPEDGSLNNTGPDSGSAARRVLIVSPQPFYEDRGTPIAVRELVRALAAMGLPVDLATFPVGQPVEIPGVRIVRTPNPFRFRRIPIGFSVRKLVLDVLLFFTVFRLLRTERYFSVHGVEEGGFIAVLLARSKRVPVIYEMQSSLPDQMRLHWPFRNRLAQRVLRACERWLIARVDLVACSAGLSDIVRAADPLVPIREWSYPVMPAGAAGLDDIESLRRDLNIAQGAPVVVYSGTFETYQGLGEVVAAIPRVSEEVPGTVFVLVGAERAGAARVTRQAKRLGLNGNLRIVSRRPLAEIAQYHALADVLLAPRALGHNLPLKLFHYMASGRAIVATGVQLGNPALEHDLALVAEHCAAGIADAVITLLRDPWRAAALGARARSFAEARLDPGHFQGAVREICLAVGGTAPR